MYSSNILCAVCDRDTVIMNLQQLQSPALGEYKTGLVNSQLWNWGETLACFSKRVIIIPCPKNTVMNLLTTGLPYL